MRSHYQKSKRRVLIAALLFSLATAPFLILFEPRSAPDRLLSLLSVVGYGFLVLGWCYYDSLERNQTLGSGFRVLIVIFGVLALFIYLFKSRGLISGLRASAIAVMLIMGVTIIMAVTAGVTAEIFGVNW